MTLAQQVEQVLRARLEIEGVATTSPERAEWRIGKQYLSMKGLDEVCIGLCALLAPTATPDRAEVRKKIERGYLRWHEYCRDNHHNGLCVPAYRFLVNALTDAVCGTEEPRWCEHFKINENMVKLDYEFISWPHVLTGSWKFCPLCATPRPGGG